MISGWRGSPWDMSEMRDRLAAEESPATVILSRDQYKAMLKGGVFFDQDCEVIIFSAETTGAGITLTAGLEEMDYFAECLAGEANHESSSARRNLLDSAYDRVTEVLEGG
jgi:hypothetical protein